MSDTDWMMFRGGVRSVTKTLADGKEHTLYYHARTPDELAAYFGALAAFAKELDAEKSVSIQKLRARFIADSMCNEDGSKLLSLQQASKILGSLKTEMCEMIIAGSNEAGDAGKE